MASSESFESFLEQGGGLETDFLQSDFQVTNERYVAFLDIMGFKDKVARHSHDEILSNLRDVADFLSQLRLNEKGISYAMFSDSLLFYTNNNVSSQFEALCRVLKELLICSTERRLAFKGAISKGTLTADSSKQLYFGQPLIDAYLLSEEVLMYGVVAHHTVEKESKNQSALLINKDVPMRSGHSHHYIVNWFEDKSAAEQSLKNIREDVSGSPRRYIDNTILVIRSNCDF